MAGCAKEKEENYLRKCFWAEEKETHIKIEPQVSANCPLNGWALNWILTFYIYVYVLNHTVMES